MNSTKPVSILLADDHVMLLELWSMILTRDPRFLVSGKASSGATAVEMARNKRPDVVIIDINMGPIDGFEATRLIRNFSPLSKIIGMSGLVLTSYAKKMKTLGAMGFVTKSSPVEEMINAILEVMKGRFYYCRQMREIMQSEEKMHVDHHAVCSHLTQREIEIIQLIKNGFSSKKIAERLEISPKTVHIHRNHIFKKLKVTSALAMVQTVQLAGL
jgi:DNA-binding NarL/FixJ family response regulator